MKRYVLFALAAALCCICAKSETVLLPYGQWSYQPWEGTYFTATIESGDEPAENWMAPDFDDSAWGTIQGPISTYIEYNLIPTPWGEELTNYWVRRKFRHS